MKGPADSTLGKFVPWVRRIDMRLLILFLVLAPATLAFLKISSEVVEGDTLAFDQMLLRALRIPADNEVPIGPAWLHQSMIDITALGGGPVLTLITILAMGYLIARQRGRLAVLLGVLIAAGGLMNNLLKQVFIRERPEIVPHLVEVSSASFPSGHAMNSAMVYLTLAALLASTERSRRVKVFLMFTALFLTLIVGASRVYLGVHWPTDVLAGWGVGSSWAVLSSIIAYNVYSRRTLSRPSSENKTL